MVDYKSVRLSDDFLVFLSRIIKNRIKADIDDIPLTRTESADIIVNYFKNNNNRYIELIKEKPKKNV